MLVNFFNMLFFGFLFTSDYSIRPHEKVMQSVCSWKTTQNILEILEPSDLFDMQYRGYGLLSHSRIGWSNEEGTTNRRTSVVRGVLTELPHVIQIKVGVPLCILTPWYFATWSREQDQRCSIELEPILLLSIKIESKPIVEVTMSDQVDVLLYGLGAWVPAWFIIFRNGNWRSLKKYILIYSLNRIGSFYAFILHQSTKVRLTVVARSNYEAVKSNVRNISQLLYSIDRQT